MLLDDNWQSLSKLRMYVPALWPSDSISRNLPWRNTSISKQAGLYKNVHGSVIHDTSQKRIRRDWVKKSAVRDLARAWNHKKQRDRAIYTDMQRRHRYIAKWRKSKFRCPTYNMVARCNYTCVYGLRYILEGGRRNSVSRLTHQWSSLENKSLKFGLFCYKTDYIC